MKKAKLSWIENKGVLIEIDGEIPHKFIVYKHDIKEECDWWDGKKACEDIFCRMPTCKELLVISENKKEIDELMKEHGGEPLKDEYYWSSSEYASYGDAWYVSPSDGGLNDYGKGTSARVRCVLDL
nr:MAG TPA: protein of unknown function DUF823 [Caudoviricetes sp.]